MTSNIKQIGDKDPMKKVNTAPISGMQELLPVNQAIFDQIKHKIEQVYHSHGFQSVETPVIDRTSILLSKAGGDTEKQVYKVIKTAESSDDADQALRFDHTVPLARYVVEHQNDLSFPFKVTQIGRNFRGERAQKGRFREFYQLDVDVIGRDDLALEYDAEVIMTAIDALKSFITEEVRVRISNRQILSGLLQDLGITHLSAEIFSIIDHAEKVPASITEQAFAKLNLKQSTNSTLLQFIQINGIRTEVIKQLNHLQIENETFKKGVTELDFVMELIEKQGGVDCITADMLIIRGLDYYTGSVFETILPAYKEIGSICSGGRYENLTSNFSDQKMPGVGISIGLTRLFFILSQYNLLDFTTKKPIDIMIVPFSKDDYETAFTVSRQLRTQNYLVDILFSDKKLKNKLTHAARIASHLILIGEEETKTGNIQVKDFSSGSSQSLADFLKS